MISLIIISGRSGSGKSTALNVLEDMGFYCIDNLPVTLLGPLIVKLSMDKLDHKVAVSVDARNMAQDLATFPDALQSLATSNVEVTIIYLDAASPTLVKRFSETRRKHPLSDQSTGLREALDLESRLLGPISDLASLSINTTSLTLHELRDEIRLRVAKTTHEFALLFQSFAYKKGVPIDADLVFDVRCLPNPHWKQELRNLTGLDHQVQNFLASQEDFSQMRSDLTTYLENWLPKFEANNRSYLTVAIGCTGGQHRSVFMCHQLFEHFRDKFENVQVRHRELGSIVIASAIQP